MRLWVWFQLVLSALERYQYKPSFLKRCFTVLQKWRKRNRFVEKQLKSAVPNIKFRYFADLRVLNQCMPIGNADRCNELPNIYCESLHTRGLIQDAGPEQSV